MASTVVSSTQSLLAGCVASSFSVAFCSASCMAAMVRGWTESWSGDHGLCMCRLPSPCLWWWALSSTWFFKMWSSMTRLASVQYFPYYNYVHVNEWVSLCVCVYVFVSSLCVCVCMCVCIHMHVHVHAYIVGSILLCPWPDVSTTHRVHGLVCPRPTVFMTQYFIACCVHDLMCSWPTVSTTWCVHGSLCPWPSVFMARCVNVLTCSWLDVSLPNVSTHTTIPESLHAYMYALFWMCVCVYQGTELLFASSAWGIFRMWTHLVPLVCYMAFVNAEMSSQTQLINSKQVWCVMVCEHRRPWTHWVMNTAGHGHSRLTHLCVCVCVFYVCVCVCVHTHVCVCVHTCVHVCGCMCFKLCLSSFWCVAVCISSFVCPSSCQTAVFSVYAGEYFKLS